MLCCCAGCRQRGGSYLSAYLPRTSDGKQFTLQSVSTQGCTHTVWFTLRPAPPAYHLPLICTLNSVPHCTCCLESMLTQTFLALNLFLLTLYPSTLVSFYLCLFFPPSASLCISLFFSLPFFLSCYTLMAVSCNIVSVDQPPLARTDHAHSQEALAAVSDLREPDSSELNQSQVQRT